MMQSASGAPEPGPAGRRIRPLLIVVGVLLAAGAIASATVPIRRVESIAETRAPRGSGPLEMQQRVVTTKTLPDALVAAVFASGVAFLVLGVMLPRVEEVTVAGTKFKLARAVAAEAVKQAQADGLVTGAVPLPVVQQIAEKSAVAAVRADKMLSSSGSHGYMPPNLVQQLAKEAVQASEEVPAN
jgi:hypothetical protein